MSYIQKAVDSFRIALVVIRISFKVNTATSMTEMEIRDYVNSHNSTIEDLTRAVTNRLRAMVAESNALLETRPLTSALLNQMYEVSWRMIVLKDSMVDIVEEYKEFTNYLLNALDSGRTVESKTTS